MIALPEWIPIEAWNGYVEMRKSIRKPLKTERAIKMAIDKLADLKAQGEDVAAVLDQSTFKSYQGLFPVQKERPAANAGRPAFAALGKHGQATANNLQDWLEEFA